MQDPASAPPPLPLLPISDGYAFPMVLPKTIPAAIMVPRAEVHEYVEDEANYTLREVSYIYDRPETPEPPAPTFQELLAANPIRGSEPPAPLRRREPSPSGTELARPPTVPY